MSKILIVDIETSDFLQRGGKIVEIGIVELDLITGERNILFDELVKEPAINLGELERAWIVKNSDLKPEDVMNAESLETLRPTIQNTLDAYPEGATAFNNSFDFGFMESRGFVFPKKLACPMKLSTNVCKLPSRNGFGYKWPKVQEAYDFFFGKTDYIEKHRGADDAFHEAQIVFELFKRGIFKLQ